MLLHMLLPESHSSAFPNFYVFIPRILKPTLSPFLPIEFGIFSFFKKEAGVFVLNNNEEIPDTSIMQQQFGSSYSIKPRRRRALTLMEERKGTIALRNCQQDIGNF